MRLPGGDHASDRAGRGSRGMGAMPRVQGGVGAGERRGGRRVEQTAALAVDHREDVVDVPGGLVLSKMA